MLPVDDADYDRLLAVAKESGLTIEEEMTKRLRRTLGPNLTTFKAGGWTEAASKLDWRKNGWWEELEDDA